VRAGHLEPAPLGPDHEPDDRACAVAPCSATVLALGQVIVDECRLLPQRGRGRFLPRPAGPAAGPPGYREPELDPEREFGAGLFE
jgi:hypothetical protein